MLMNCLITPQSTNSSIHHPTKRGTPKSSKSLIHCWYGNLWRQQGIPHDLGNLVITSLNILSALSIARESNLLFWLLLSAPADSSTSTGHDWLCFKYYSPQKNFKKTTNSERMAGDRRGLPGPNPKATITTATVRPHLDVQTKCAQERLTRTPRGRRGWVKFRFLIDFHSIFRYGYKSKAWYPR